MFDTEVDIAAAAVRLRLRAIGRDENLPSNIFLSDDASASIGIKSLFDALVKGRKDEAFFDSAIWTGQSAAMTAKAGQAGSVLSHHPIINGASRKFYPSNKAADLVCNNLSKVFRHRAMPVGHQSTKDVRLFFRNIFKAVHDYNPESAMYWMWMKDDRLSEYKQDIYAMHIDPDPAHGHTLPNGTTPKAKDCYRMLVYCDSEGSAFVDRQEWQTDDRRLSLAMPEDEQVTLWQPLPWSVSLFQAQSSGPRPSIHGTPAMQPDKFVGRYRQILSGFIWAPEPSIGR